MELSRARNILSLSRYRGYLKENINMKRLLLIGFAACAFAVVPTLSASAMPRATPDTLVAGTDSAVILAKGGHGHGHGHMGRGGRGHHYGWSHGRHRGWH
jgi:hypothetical protein